MSQRRRVVLGVGASVSVLTLLYPPWQYRDGHLLHWHFRSADEPFVSWQRLALPFLALSLVVGTLHMFAGGPGTAGGYER